MKKRNVKIIALLLVLALSAWGCASVFAADSGRETTPTEAETEVPATEAAETASPAHSTGSPVKDETVYVLAGADGKVNRVIVSDWLKNGAGEDSLQDRSELTDLENVKGDETFTRTGSDLVWAAGGRDLSYRGETDKALPVTVDVTYTLDGAPITAEDLAGKSGRVTIRFDYQNHETVTADVDGKPTALHVPFAVVTGLVLDEARFSNVTVTNGKVLSDGTRTAVVGLALPGMQEDLGLASSVLTLPDSVEITADAVDFSLGMSLTLVSNEVFASLDLSKLDSADGLEDALTQLTDAMTQLCDGSDELSAGLETLLEKSGELQTGADQLADGAKALKRGAGDLSTGAGQVSDGADSLSAGLNTLSANSASLNSGAKQIFETLLTTAAQQIRAAGLDIPDLTISNYAQVLSKAIAALDDDAVCQQALDTVTAAVEAHRGEIRTAVTAAVREQVQAKVTEGVRAQVLSQVTAAVREQVAAQVIPAVTNGQMTAETYAQAVAAGLVDEQTQAAIAAAIDQQMASDAVQAQISAAVDAQMASDAIQTQISALTDAQMQSDEIRNLIAQTVDEKIRQKIAEQMAGPEVQAQLAAASEGAKTLISLKTSLDSYNTFYTGLGQYTAGVDSAAAGAGELRTGAAALASGAGDLKTGVSQLYSGTKELRDSIPALIDGVTRLRDGAKALSEGLHRFDEEGVQKLVDAVDGDLEGLLSRVRACVKLAGDYQNFSGLADGMEGRVRFLYRTDEIHAAD